MRLANLVVPVTLLLSLATAAQAQSEVDKRLTAEATRFVAEEAKDATKAQQAAMVDCILEQFAGLDDAAKNSILAEDDFEDSLDTLVETYPDTEDALEGCLG